VTALPEDRGVFPTTGPPARDWIPLSAVDIGATEAGYVQTALADGWISGTGPFVARFEDGMSDRVGRRHTVAVANGTLAVELALRGLGIGPGDEVIVPALTFAAPAMSVIAVGATPVPVDVTRETWTICPDAAAAAITAATRAILAVDVLGHPADYDALGALGLPVIEDAAEAHGAEYKGRSVGGFGVVSVFSFHANKTIATGEGGCVCTDSSDLAERMRVIAHHGMRPERPYVNEVVGRNFRMTNLTAAIGLGQLDRWDELVAARNRVGSRYRELLVSAACGHRPRAAWATYACWLETVVVERREPVLEHVRGLGIDARGIWPALADQPILGRARHPQPIAQDIAAHALWLPTHTRLSDDEIEYVAATLADAVGPARDD
jgi:perosamine synthetase